jgi:glycerol-3-phosphate dehydrogenase
MQQRQATIERLREHPEIPVLIIGGGANGAGTFRELALNGVDVLLVERGDFCSGASAGSSHMLHGGIRYLENAEFRLVREALRERNLLLVNAPHLAKPLPTTIPIYHWFSGLFNAPLKFLGLRNQPAERGAIVIKAGLIMYDLFTRNNRQTPTHTFRLRKATLARYPAMNSDIVCSATYYDAWMPSPERLVLETLMDGLAAGPHAMALNYVAVEDGQDGRVMLRDAQSGEALVVQPQVVINAAGPWIDFVNRAMGRETTFIGGTKGSHLMLDNDALLAACNGAEIFFENDDGRIVLIFPLLGKVMVGTTDIRIDHPDQAVCTEDEIAYILGLIPKIFPGIPVTRDQIVFTFSGVRPLPHSDKAYTGNVSRDHSIEVLEANESLRFPVFSLIGGKWTSFRALSAQTADAALARLGRARTVHTDHLAIGGGRDHPMTEAERGRWVADLARETGLDAARVTTLLERYGTQARAVALYLAAGADAPLAAAPDYSRREIAYMAAHEHVQHVDDVLLRRTSLAILGDHSAALIAEIADILAEELGWSAAQREAEIARVGALLRERHLVGVE